MSLQASWVTGDVKRIPEAMRAQRAWRLIKRWGQMIPFKRAKQVTPTGTIPAVTLAPQLVRIETDSRASTISGVAGIAPTRSVIIYGVKDHPDPLVLDTIMEEGFTFALDGDSYRCTDVLQLPGQIQGVWVVNG